MKPVLSYLKYRWNAVGRHGVHSPFVYNLLEKVIYIKSPKIQKSFTLEKQKEFHLYLRLLLHFKPKTIWLNRSNIYFEELINQYKKNNTSSDCYTSISSSPPAETDFYFFNQATKQQIDSFISQKNIIKEDATVIFLPLHASKIQLQNWEEFISSDLVTISLDFYNFGLVFFQKGKAKQDYIIKYF